jgi:hypothetical protein
VPLAHANQAAAAAATATIGQPGVDSMQTAWMIVFKAVLNVDGDYTALDWENWNLFRAQSECVSREGRGNLLAAKLMAANAAATTLPMDEQLRTRRPSKIQWTDRAVDSPGSEAHESPPFNGPVPFFNPDYTLGDNRTMGSPPPPDHAASRASSPANSTSRFVPSSEKSAPRRSSLARGHLASELERASFNDSANRETTTPGVAPWDPDWLARLLREDLYLRQDWDDDV